MRTVHTLLALTVSFLTLASESLFARQLASYHEPSTLESVYGMDHTPIPSRKSKMRLSVLPYHQHAANAKDNDHEKVPLGDRLGQINMLGLLINDGPSSYENKFGTAGAESDSALHAAYDALADHVDGNAADDIFLGDTYEPLDSTDVRSSWGKYRTELNYRRIGLRSGLDYCFSNGVGVAVRSGLSEYSIRASYLPNPVYNTTTASWENASIPADTGTAVKVMESKLMSQGRQLAIGTDLGVDFAGVSTTGLEDTSIELYWRKGFSMKDAEGDHVVTAIPYVSVGVTLPTAEKKKTSRLYDIALGNDGFYGFTGQAEVSFNFPGMVKIGAGACVTIFDEANIGKQYVPTSEYQYTLYPWQTTVTKRPGALWKVYATMKAHHFIDYLSCYMSYVLVAHERDSISLSGTNKALFLPLKLAQDGQYNAQLLHIGFEYEVTPALRFGLGVQSVFAGKKIWKTSTVAGSLSFVF